ncbi:biofilm development regulator YmgB/AriR family protein [Rahnella variigena]|jgi:hypothetical protein|uniref:biofilm development regulator YmgB/AriR family protein n=1 Tax=Rahnella variigena TaxID=574964 RepID=UPI003D2948B8
MPNNSSDADDFLPASDIKARESDETENPDVLLADIVLICSKYESELEVIGAVVCDLIRSRGVLNFSDIVLRLIVQLELTGNLMQKSILRNAIYLVANVTPKED